MFSKGKWLRRLILAVLGAAITTQIIVLSPSSLEDTKPANEFVDPNTLVQDQSHSLAPGIPKGRIAEYSIDQFHYVSVQNGVKQWRIEAETAFLYNPERMVHARKVKAYLYDPEGKITVVTGKEAKYFLNQKDLEMFGDVQTVFPDGFRIESDYLRYRPNHRHIQIPTQYLATGTSEEDPNQRFRYKSHGLDYYMGESQIKLLEDVTVTLEKGPPLKEKEEGVPDLTTIVSDHCLIYRNRNLAKFTMNPKRPLKDRFVHITQPTLFTRSRRADLHYGDFSKILQYLTAYEDVLIKETGKNSTSLRYATCGKADFDTHKDVIVLTQFPQVYQDEDTVIGDIILMHRDTDIVEIEHSNAFSKGSESDKE